MCCVVTGAALGLSSLQSSPLVLSFIYATYPLLLACSRALQFAFTCALSALQERESGRGQEELDREDERQHGDAGAGVRGRGARRPGGEELDAGPRPPAPQPHRRELRQGRRGKRDANTAR
jgi:hypothetical protein